MQGLPDGELFAAVALDDGGDEVRPLASDTHQLQQLQYNATKYNNLYLVSHSHIAISILSKVST